MNPEQWDVESILLGWQALNFAVSTSFIAREIDRAYRRAWIAELYDLGGEGGE